MMHSQNNYHNNMNLHSNVNYSSNNLQQQPNHTNNSLFIGDLSKFCTEQDLEALFGKYGEITDVKIKRNITTGKTLSYGFVTFVDDECASHAMEELDGFLYGGRNLRIRWAVHNIRDQKVEEQIINSVYVRFITTNINELITEEHFHKVFDQFGNVEDVSIKESTLDKRTSRQSGYGFVHFSCNNAGIAAAFQAVSVVDNQTFDSVLYNVELSKNLLRQFNEMKIKERGMPHKPNPFNNMPVGSGSMSITPPAHLANDRVNNNYRDHNFRSGAPETGFNGHGSNHHGMNHRFPHQYDEVPLGVGRANSDATVDDFYNPDKSFGSRRSVSMPPTATIGSLINQYPQQKNNYQGGSSRGGGNGNYGGNNHGSKSQHQQHYQGEDSFMPSPSGVGSIGPSSGGGLLPPRLAPSVAGGGAPHRQAYGIAAKGNNNVNQSGSSLPSRSNGNERGLRSSEPPSALYTNGDFNMDYFQAVAPNTSIIPPSGMYGGSSFLDDVHSAPVELNSRSSSGHTTTSNGTHLSAAAAANQHFSNSHFNQGGESLSRSNSGNYRKNQSHNDLGMGSISRSNSLPSTANMFKQQGVGQHKNSSDAALVQVVDPGLHQINRSISGPAYFKNPDLQMVDRPLSRSNSGHTVGGGAVLNNKTGNGQNHNSGVYFKHSAMDEHFSMQHFDSSLETEGRSSLFGGNSKSIAGVDASSLHVGSLHVGSSNSAYFKHSTAAEDQFSMQHFDTIADHIENHSSLFSAEPKINQWTASLTDPKFDASHDKELKRISVPPGLRSEGGSSPPGLIGGDRSLSPPGLQKLVRNNSLVILDPNGVEVPPRVSALADTQLDLLVARIPGLSVNDEATAVMKEALAVMNELDTEVDPNTEVEPLVEESPVEEEEEKEVMNSAVEDLPVITQPPAPTTVDVSEVGDESVSEGKKNQQDNCSVSAAAGESSSKAKQRTLKDFFRPVAK